MNGLKALLVLAGDFFHMRYADSVAPDQPSHLRATLSAGICGSLGQDCSTLVCDKLSDPVCGSNGVTYHNNCFLQKAACGGAKVDVAHLGACVSPLVSHNDCSNINCTGVDTTTAVCGTDGHTYHGKCEFLAAQCKYGTINQKLDVAHMGACTATLTNNQCQRPASCDTTPAKICGDDGSTYENYCEFQQAVCKYALAGYRLVKSDCSDGSRTTLPTKG